MTNFENKTNNILANIRKCNTNRDEVFMQAVQTRLDKSMASYLSELASFEKQLKWNDELTAAKKLNKVIKNGCSK